jgi:hypothetical protein
MHNRLIIPMFARTSEHYRTSVAAFEDACDFPWEKKDLKPTLHNRMVILVFART